MKATVYQQLLLSQASHFARTEPCLRKLPARVDFIEMEQFNILFPSVPASLGFLATLEYCSTPKKQKAYKMKTVSGNRSLKLPSL